MKFYMTPGSCSTGIHILLEEIGLVFEAHVVDLLAGDHQRADYLAINPRGTVPTLVRDDAPPLTDFQSIAVWLGKAYPQRRLLPLERDSLNRVLDVMNYAVRTIHGKGFSRVFVPERFLDRTTGEVDVDTIVRRGREIVSDSFTALRELLGEHPYVVEHLTIADAALFYVEFWACRSGITLPPECLAHYRRMLARPAVRQVLAEEGYRSELVLAHDPVSIRRWVEEDQRMFN